MNQLMDDVCVCCGKPIAAEGLGLLCYSCSKDTDEAIEGQKERLILLTAAVITTRRVSVKKINRIVSLLQRSSCISSIEPEDEKGSTR